MGWTVIANDLDQKILEILETQIFDEIFKYIVKSKASYIWKYCYYSIFLKYVYLDQEMAENECYNPHWQQASPQVAWDPTGPGPLRSFLIIR